MTLTPLQIGRNAGLVLVAGFAAVWVGLGLESAAVFGVTGVAMLANLAAWAWVVRTAVENTVRGDGAGLAPIIWLLKVVALLATMVALLSQFPALPVLLGSSVVVAALLGSAVMGLGTALQVEEARS